MVSRDRLASVLLCIVTLASDGARGQAFGSAWNPPQGSGLIIADYTFSGGDRYFNGEGRLSPAAAYTKSAGSAYIEYGLTDSLMAVVRPEVVDVAVKPLSSERDPTAPANRYIGLGTSDIGAQLHLLTFGPAVMAAQASFRLPATTNQTNPALIGATSRDVDLRWLGGVSFEVLGAPAFVDVQTAYRFRFEGAPDEWHGDLALGIRPVPRLLLLLENAATVPVARGTAWFPASLFVKTGLSVVYDLTPHWSCEVGLFQTWLGVDALRERGVHTAVWYRF